MKIETPLFKLTQYIESEKFMGYDPYDALNSPFLQVLSFRQKYLRIAFIQLLKQLPINLRPLLGIKKDYNPKGLGLFLWGYVKLYRIEPRSDYRDKIDDILNLLENLKSKGYPGNSWGYNFDWQSRAFFVPKFTPTIVNSSFIGHALLDAWLYARSEKARAMALPIADFIMNSLNRHEEDGVLCFSYTPLDRYFVHNANLLGASLLVRLYEITKNLENCSENVLPSTAQNSQSRVKKNLLNSHFHGNDSKSKNSRDLWKSAGLAALTYSMRHQRDDGSWFYAEKEGAHWIDSFHTGFNLQSILHFLKAGFAEEHRPAFEKGVQFYKNNFFLTDGTPKYYAHKIYPVDVHSPAQAIVFFSQLGQEYHSLTTKIFSWMVANLQDERGYFYFQKKTGYTNKIPYIRWGQAWAFHALTESLFFS